MELDEKETLLQVAKNDLDFALKKIECLESNLKISSEIIEEYTIQMSKKLTVRDQFAMAALAGDVANTTRNSAILDTDKEGSLEIAKGMAEQAYMLADAMLKARESKC